MVRNRISYRTNTRKALEVILWCAQKRDPVEFHCALKVLFGADIVHLNRYGRPVVGDDYKALQYGPVPQTTYDIMKKEPLALSALGEDVEDVPFDVVHGHLISPKRGPDLDYLSASDIEALEEGWRLYGGLNFSARTRKSHDHPAWKNAWDNGLIHMDYVDFLDEENRTPEKIKDIAEMAEALRM